MVMIDPSAAPKAGPINITIVTATMAVGQLSTVIDASNGRINHIQVPEDWGPAANLTFQVSLENGPYFDLYNARGDEVMIPANAGTVIDVETFGLGGARFKLRSGRSGAGKDTEQTGVRTFRVTIAQ